MLEKNDWRLTTQEKYLMKARLCKEAYVQPTLTWDHDHCEFCWATFSEAPDTLHVGYHSVKGGHWICETCFQDFKELFKFTLAE